MSSKTTAFISLAFLLQIGVFSLPIGADEAFPILFTPEMLAATDHDPLLIDVRSAHDFLEKRLPDSVWLWSGEFAETRGGIPGMLPPQDKLLDLLMQRGISPERPLILYGAGNNAGDVIAPARVFWALELLGYPEVALLDGGLSRWEAEGHPTVSEPPASPLPPLTDQPAFLPRDANTDKKAAAHAHSAKSATFVDARPQNQFLGSVTIRGMERPGHIPGAANIPYHTVLSMPHGVFKSPAELATLLYPDGVDREKPVIVYCNTGAFSSVLYYAYRLIGHEQVANYDGGMFEWSADASLPVSTDGNESN